MKLSVFVLAALLSVAALSHAAGREFACADYSVGRVCLIDSAGQITWEHPAKHCNDVWVLPSGNLLFTTGHGVLEVTRDKQVVFKYESKSEIYACQRLPDGNTFIGECNAGRLLEVAPDGKIVKEIRLLPEGKDGGHGYMRNSRKLANGHYLVTHTKDHVVREYDGEGKIVREIPAKGGPHSVARLANGNTIIAVGDQPGGSRVFEVDPAGNTVWQISNEDLPGDPLAFMTGFHRLPNGNTVISNWLGHNRFGTAPHLYEIAPDNKVVWTFNDHTNFRTVSTVQVLGIDGEPIH
jgi:hypothetical protein